MPRCRPETLGRRSRPLHGTEKRGGPVEAAGDVEALDPLARRALDEVVERGGDHCLLPLRADVDQAQVGVRRELRGRSLVNDPGERLTRVELAVRFLELPGRTLEVEVAGGQDASSHGCQM